LDRLADPRCDTDPWISLVASSRALADADPRTMALVREISIRSQDGDVAAEARALEELIETHRPEGAGLAWATARLGNVLNAMGAHRRAAARLEPALVEVERLDAPVLRGVLQAEAANALAQWPGREAEALALARRAISALAEAPDAAPHRPGAYGALAVAAWRSHQPAVAVEATVAGLAALADDGDDGWRAHDEALARAQLLNLQALALQDLDRGAEALVALGEAAALVEQTVPNHPDLGRILNNLGDLERSMGQLDLAVVHLERALALKRASGQPDAAMTAMNLGNLRLHAGALEPALRHYAEAEALLPPDAAVEHRAELLYNRAIAEQGLEHHARAAEGYSMVLALLAPQPAADPEVRYGAHLGRGLAQLRLGEDALARRDLEDALALEPAGVASTDALDLRLGLALAQPRAVAARYEALVAEARAIATRASPSWASLASWRAQFEAAGRPWPLAASAVAGG
jgi:tetratricopeptide (TPR) repeat protein